MKTPWHLWLVGILGALWSAGGCFDYVMTATQNEAYFENLPEDIQEFYWSLPGWYMALFALAVWGGLLGCILLLLRMKLAAPVFLISLVATILSFIWTLFIAEGGPEMGGGQWAFTIAILVVSIFLVGYSYRMKKAGVLR